MREVTLVTGATGALGSRVVERLLAHGHLVAAVGRPGSSFPSPVMPMLFDPRDPDAWLSAVERVSGEAGPVTKAVLAAGAWRGGGAFHSRTDEGTWSSLMEANVDSVRRALRAILPGMVRHGAGSVVMVASRAGVRPETSTDAAEYAASKAAAIALCQAVAAEVLESRVRVNALLPSTIDTPPNRAAMPGADTSRWVSPDSIAEVIEFLLSEGARDISGAAIPVYGRA